MRRNPAVGWQLEAALQLPLERENPRYARVS